jgi:hypothetical protein
MSIQAAQIEAQEVELLDVYKTVADVQQLRERAEEKTVQLQHQLSQAIASREVLVRESKRAGK